MAFGLFLNHLSSVGAEGLKNEQAVRSIYLIFPLNWTRSSERNIMQRKRTNMVHPRTAILPSFSWSQAIFPSFLIRSAYVISE